MLFQLRFCFIFRDEKKNYKLKTKVEVRWCTTHHNFNYVFIVSDPIAIHEIAKIIIITESYLLVVPVVFE